MIATTIPGVPGREIESILGVVKGNTVRARHLGHDMIANLKNIVGGEIDEYTKLMAESREQALDRMMQSARDLGADAVVGISMTTSMIQSQAAEILVFGTAVKLR